MPSTKTTRTRKPARGIDRATKDWIRNASDEIAAKNGCRFDVERAQYTVDWIERYCYLYEGEYAGQPMTLRDWPLEAVQRMFGWVRYSDDWGREVRRFRRASIWVPKKNKKSPTLAGIGLYLLCGDGEQGQKVFTSAKDGRQAMIAHTHAMEMVKRSPELSGECKVNQSTGQITHEPSRSFYKVVSGDNINSQEGLNGCVMVDETHVVDRRLMTVLRGAGISRSEPLQLEVSTAGNNPDSYGKSQWEHGRQVEAGKFVDEQFFYLGYGAPQDLSDEVLERDLIKIGKAANPAWGHTIKEGEFVADYHSSKRSMSELADFKMYRLNIWQRSTNPFLKESDWSACADTFTEDDLEGEACWAGLDLSKTRDMTALVLIFPHDEGYRVLPFFWMPEQAAREANHLVSFLAWAEAGHLTLTPGAVTDYGFIRSEFRRLAGRFSIQGLAYDQTYAEETTQELEQGVMGADGAVIEEGTGIPRVVFKQNLMTFAPVCKEFERLVIAHKFYHADHPILTWQAGHVEVYRDCNANMRPIKPKRNDVRKIDGIVAGMMALGLAMSSEGNSGDWGFAL